MKIFLTHEELGAVIQCLSEICSQSKGGSPIYESEFETRIGASQDFVDNLIDRLLAQYSDVTRKAAPK
jgi:hypothetical protein